MLEIKCHIKMYPVILSKIGFLLEGRTSLNFVISNLEQSLALLDRLKWFQDFFVHSKIYFVISNF